MKTTGFLYRWLQAIALFVVTASLAGETTMPTDTASPITQERLWRAFRDKGPGYVPRTRHLRPDGRPQYINALILESSPYLLQHAHNPVNWRSWSPAALAEARAKNKLVFLSVGYATCHWCHVMEEESFEDPTVAQWLNEHFIPIKVDREERPAVDDYYMTAVQLLSGHGGWPMSVFLTPEGKPFFGGTYYPKAAFIQLLQRVSGLWQKQPDALRQQAEQLHRAIARYHAGERAARTVSPDASHAAVDQLLQMHDELQGGFGTAPKFPQETWLAFLQDMWARSGDANIAQALANTLSAMQQGGINDQAGGGFHRYATDPAWRVPHFEKMLYNQAQLAEVYARGWLQHGHREDRRTAIRILEYLLRDMRNPQGVFYSASDADSRTPAGKMEEGFYFTWTVSEFQQALADLPNNTRKLATRIYPIQGAGPVAGRHVLHRRQSLPQLAAQSGLNWPELLSQLDTINAHLLTARNQRPRPLLDKKIITAWNAHAIRALANGAVALNRPDFLEAAQKAADYVWRVHRRPQTMPALLRSSLDGKPGALPATLEDHAQLILAMLAIYDASGERQWLQQAKQLYDEIPEALQDKNGAFYDSLPDAATPWRPQTHQAADAATPSGQALMLQALAQLWRRTGTVAYRQKYFAALQAVAGQVSTAPLSHASTLLAHHWMENGEISPLAHATGGHLRIQGHRRGKSRFSLALQTDPGWHLSAHDDNSQQDFRLSVASGWPVAIHTVDWPVSDNLTTAFQQIPLKTWSGTVELPVTLKQASEDGFPVTLRVQACSDRICLPRETVTLWIPASKPQ